MSHTIRGVLCPDKVQRTFYIHAKSKRKDGSAKGYIQLYDSHKRISVSGTATKNSRDEWVFQPTPGSKNEGVFSHER